MTHHHARKALFALGQIVATPAALGACDPVYLTDCLTRHVTGDWGCICADDRELNDSAVQDGERILSAYPINPALPSKGHGDNTLWIITEHDRSVTTFLLPDDY